MGRPAEEMRAASPGILPAPAINQDTPIERYASVIAVISLFNGAETIRKCLDHLLSQTYPVTKVVIVDDASTDNSINVVGQFRVGQPKITLLRHDDNRGLGASIATGMSYAMREEADWIWLFDQDSYPLPDCLAQLMHAVNTYDSDNWGIVTPRFVNPHSPKMYDYVVYWGSNGYVTRPQPSGRIHEYDIGITSGSLVRASVVAEVGTFRTDFYCGLEDHEYYLRVREARYKVVRVRDAVLHHVIGTPKQFRILGKTYTLAYHPPWRCYYYFRNDIIIFRERLGTWGAVRRLVGLVDHMCVVLMLEPHRLRKLYYTFKGIAAGFRTKLGKTHDR